MYFVTVSLHGRSNVLNVAIVYVCWFWNIFKSIDCREAYENVACDMQEAVCLIVCICIYSCVSVVAEHSVLQCMWHLLWTCYGGCRLFWTLCATMYVASPLNLLAWYHKECKAWTFTGNHQCALRIAKPLLPERNKCKRVWFWRIYIWNNSYFLKPSNNVVQKELYMDELVFLELF